MVKINGEKLDVAGKTIAEYLATTKYDPNLICFVMLAVQIGNVHMVEVNEDQFSNAGSGK